MVASVTPMFPLGAVLVPGASMPLHVFEPRYRAMVGHCIEHDVEFGVVLIERGHEVGGGDSRADVGCLARIESSKESPDGRFGIVCVGTTRIRISEWLVEDPYPTAMTEPWPDEQLEPSGIEIEARSEALAGLLRSTLGLCAEAGMQVSPATLELSQDPEEMSYQAAAVAPIGSFDRYQALASATTIERIDALISSVTQMREMVEMRLGETGEAQS